jgi:fumarate hydratase subunit beta
MRELKLPLSCEDAMSLQAYERVLLNGSILVGRDQVHKRFAELISSGSPLPISLTGETIYYMGPAATPAGMVIGSCGPTTSARMDPFTPQLFDFGLLATIGKGPRSAAVVDAITNHHGVYFVAFGGCGALYAKRIVSQTIVAFEDLGPEALMRLEVAQFPVVVGIDSRGKSVFR